MRRRKKRQGPSSQSYDMCSQRKKVVKGLFVRDRLNLYSRDETVVGRALLAAGRRRLLRAGGCCCCCCCVETEMPRKKKAPKLQIHNLMAEDALAAEDAARLRLEAAAAKLGTVPPPPPLVRPPPPAVTRTPSPPPAIPAEEEPSPQPPVPEPTPPALPTQPPAPQTPPAAPLSETGPPPGSKPPMPTASTDFSLDPGRSYAGGWDQRRAREAEIQALTRASRSEPATAPNRVAVYQAETRGGFEACLSACLRPR